MTKLTNMLLGLDSRPSNSGREAWTANALSWVGLPQQQRPQGALSEKLRKSFHSPRKTFSDAEKQAVWDKAQYINPSYERFGIRLDSVGALLQHREVGNTNHPMGWQIDHKIPIAKGGGNELTNLQPLHWRNNEAKGDGLYPIRKVWAENGRNVEFCPVFGTKEI